MSDPASSKYAPVPGKIPGTTINLGGLELVLAPLNLDGVQEAEPLFKSYGEATGFPAIAAIAAQILVLSLRRNYPDITVEDVRPLIDTRNVVTALKDLAALSGFASGETTPASP